MSIGAFSLSLAVKDIEVSKKFYETLGFKSFAGVLDDSWIIMQNGDVTIGLFQGMFEKNMMTFNPGWNDHAENLESFKDIRVLQEELRDKGIKFETEVEENTEGPGSFIISDPDGNPILVDQHR
ncbi:MULTISPECIES: VOC family protein [unclassified Fusibacter]|uniref:VOC family protein n=1 Tax=unclassified Fusibacter TaxID=2624464 RepID=UPI001010627F|nr:MULTISPECIES: VOC family protein [unclassified Fusibacter]MCK8058387.1 VOC family protein [Fusibacter sp. A2]NPE20970.1 VOC family protein [Fusibacter sp. A1]RXV63190.1 VOC family protein [Fusibacter sp. A1]